MTAAWEPLWPYRAVLAVDARNFSANTSRVMGEINTDIQRLLAEALSEVGCSGRWERRMFAQHTGDGYVAGLEPESLPALVGLFPGSLRSRLDEWRVAHPDQAPLQLRVSIHVGPPPLTGLGVPMVETHRLLDSEASRDILAKADPTITNTAVVISHRVYEDVVTSGCSTGGMRPEHLQRHLVRVKTFEQPAWLLVPGLDWRLVDPGLIERPSIAEPDASGPGAGPSGNVVLNHHGDHGQQAYEMTNHYHGEGR